MLQLPNFFKPGTEDQFGLSWQIAPKRFLEFVGDRDSRKVQVVIGAMMKIGKLDVALLERAYNEAR